MSTTFPFVEIQKNLLSRIGRPDPGTRIYRKQGPEEDMGAWFSLLCSEIGPSLSPGGVRMYCPVSRAAVHKRAKEGKLSIFLYHSTYAKKGLFGKIKKVRQSPYAYIPLTEIQAWREEIEERAIKKNEVTREELEGSKPDVDGDFLNWPVKSERPGLMDTLREMGYATPMDVVAEAITNWRKSGKTEGIKTPVTERGEMISQRERVKRKAADTELTKEKARRKRNKSRCKVGSVKGFSLALRAPSGAAE